MLNFRSRNSSGLSAMMGDKLKDLARRFSMRTDRMKEKVIQPATPSTTEKERDEDDTSGKNIQQRIRISYEMWTLDVSIVNGHKNCGVNYLRGT